MNFDLCWRNGKQIVVYKDGRPSESLQATLKNASRYAWISSHFTEFMAILKKNPQGGFEVECAIDRSIESAGNRTAAPVDLFGLPVPPEYSPELAV